MSSWKMPFEMSGEFRLIPKHLGTRDFSRTSCQNTDMHLPLDWLRGRQNSNRSLPRIFGCSTPEQREAEIGAELLRIGEPDPKHRQGLDGAAHSKRASIDRLKAEIGGERQNHVFGGHVVAGNRHHELAAAIPTIGILPDPVVL